MAARTIKGRERTSPTRAAVISNSRLMISVRGVLTNPSEKMSQLGRTAVTKILPVAFS